MLFGVEAYPPLSHEFFFCSQSETATLSRAWCRALRSRAFERLLTGKWISQPARESGEVSIQSQNSVDYFDGDDEDQLWKYILNNPISAIKFLTKATFIVKVYCTPKFYDY
jgi:hypothetical protein